MELMLQTNHRRSSPLLLLFPSAGACCIACAGSSSLHRHSSHIWLCRIFLHTAAASPRCQRNWRAEARDPKLLIPNNADYSAVTIEQMREPTPTAKKSSETKDKASEKEERKGSAAAAAAAAGTKEQIEKRGKQKKGEAAAADARKPEKSSKTGKGVGAASARGISSVPAVSASVPVLSLPPLLDLFALFGSSLMHSNADHLGALTLMLADLITLPAQLISDLRTYRKQEAEKNNKKKEEAAKEEERKKQEEKKKEEATDMDIEPTHAPAAPAPAPAGSLLLMLDPKRRPLVVLARVAAPGAVSFTLLVQSNPRSSRQSLTARSSLSTPPLLFPRPFLMIPIVFSLTLRSLSPSLLVPSSPRGAGSSYLQRCTATHSQKRDSSWW
jgi:hypothetical protein